MTYQTLSLSWQGIPFTLAFAPDYFTSLGMAHIEIRCDEPLPLTETGYKSIFVSKNDIADIKIAAALVLDSLNRTAKQNGCLFVFLDAAILRNSVLAGRRAGGI